MMRSIEESLTRRISETLNSNTTPVVLLDLDDTLIDCRHRKLAVLKDFCAANGDLPQVKTLAKIELEQIRFRIAHCLENMGIVDEEFTKSVIRYWLDHYFTYPYLINDQPFLGAEDFVQRLHQTGAHLVYLTARDIPGMQEGTIEFLEGSEFPFPEERVSLLMKPDKDQKDRDFKQEILSKVASMGKVVASFENELPHLNHMAEFFPDAIMVWRDTQYVPDPPPPHENVLVLKTFLMDE